MTDPWTPYCAQVVDRVAETPDVVTLSLRFADPDVQSRYRFACGQFNMLYLYGLGEVPISIMDYQDGCLQHTIRAVGRVSRGLTQLQPGASIGLRGPYGNSWPLEEARGRDLLFITAGLGCAPVIAAIRRAIAERDSYRRLVIMQGVKHREDMLWQAQYDRWREVPDCQVLLAASEEKQAPFAWSLGMVTTLIDKACFDPDSATVMMCGPEPMMRASIRALEQKGVAAENCYFSLERNMQCALGLCGHCQMGAPFICKNGPIFRVSDVREWFLLEGY
ncbi:Ni/Fe hydrogenase subunit gamma [Marinobacterium nitratireducens]|uniref:Ni/Fe hydrogenase subunit gamma n=1 Tax=Marinobacterium nitratireducens TaxID=518897 RepID=A0A917ZPH7_9GAMM|nr:FAD/NAD(P)-binding protein [Marinobacterium nitratireducens]GGO86931.1 Ni/Fe hydrogenase subunit gamma [Marinobacterium nitratireducens]